MGGFRRKVQTFNVEFAPGHELYGLVFTARRVRLREFMEIADLAMLGGDDVPIREQARGVGALCDRLAEVLVSWNLEDEDGQAVPCTADALVDQDMAFVLALCTAWMDAIGGVPAPLGDGSTSGEPSLEASIPQAAL